MEFFTPYYYNSIVLNLFTEGSTRMGRLAMNDNMVTLGMVCSMACCCCARFFRTFSARQAV